MQAELQTALFHAFDTLNLQQMKSFNVPPVTLHGVGALAACGPQAQSRGLRHLFVMVDSFLHQAGMTHGRPALRDFLYEDGRVTLLDWENQPRSENIKKRKTLDYLLLLLSLFREPYARKDYVEALEKGYADKAGGETREWARTFLRKHALIGHLAKALDVFHMKDVEAFSKLYSYLVGKRGI